MKTNEAVSREIVKLEKSYWQAMVDDDLEHLLELTDFPCIVAGSHGAMTVGKEEYKKMYKSGGSKVKKFKFDDAKTDVRQLSPDTAVIAYKVTSTFSHEGKEKTVDAVDTSTWVKHGGKWACAMHTETELLKQ